ncbi:retention module-containing protein, partial [Affinibrenneria salicis]
MNSVIGIIKAVIGQAFVISLDGTRRLLTEGDRIHRGEEIVTSDNGAVTISLADGHTLDLGRNTLWGETTGITAADAASKGSDEVASLQQAIAQGADPTQILDPTAAGNEDIGEAGDGGGSHTAVVLDLTGKVVDPTSGFATNGLNGTSDNVDDTETAASTLVSSNTDTTDTSDTTAPSLTVTIGDNGTVEFTFSETPSGFTPGDVTVEHGTLGDLVQDANDPTHWTAVLTPENGYEGTVTVSVPDGSYSDAAGNPGSGGSASTVVDTLAPSVTVTIGDNGTVEFTFSETPSGFTPGDVTVEHGTLGDLVQDANDPTHWTAVLTPENGYEGTVTVSVPDGSYSDAAGNPGSGGSASTVVDTLAPSVTVTIGDNGTVEFTFSETPSGFTPGDVTVEHGTLGDLVQDANDPTHWTAVLTPENGYEGTVTVSVPDGSYSDAAGNPGSGGSASTVVDTLATAAPVVTITEDANNDGVISQTELQGQIDVRVGLPAGAVAGDTLSVTDGATQQNVVLTAENITNGYIDTAFANPGEGQTIQVDAVLHDQYGNVSDTGSDSARVDTLAGDSGAAPLVTITEDANNDGVISQSELQGQIDVRVGLPAGAVAGDTLSVTDGATQQTVVLTAEQISNGYVDTAFANPGEGSTIKVDAVLHDQYGNVSDTGSDSARVDTLAGDTGA